MKFKVIVTGKPIADSAVELLKSHDIELIALPTYTPSNELARLIADIQASGIILRTGEITEEVIAASAKMRVIAKHGVGVDNINLGAASARQIPVMITQDANTRAVSEHALAMMMSLYKHILPLKGRMCDGLWDKATHRGTELTGKHLGLIGRGAIALDLVKLVQPFGMKVSCYVRSVSDSPSLQGINQLTDLNELLQISDVVSVHCPLNEKTRKLLDRNSFQLMKRSAILINTARGGIIDEDALVEALSSGEIAGAGLDCFELEPTGKENPLLALSNVITTPHIGFATHDSLDRMGMITAENIISVLVNQSPIIEHIVNSEFLETKN